MTNSASRIPHTLHYEACSCRKVAKTALAPEPTQGRSAPEDTCGRQASAGTAALTHRAGGQLGEALGGAVAHGDDAQVAQRVLVEELPDEPLQNSCIWMVSL